jgi:hypothetical protein
MSVPLLLPKKKPSPRKNTLINNGEKKKENVLTLREEASIRSAEAD